MAQVLWVTIARCHQPGLVAYRTFCAKLLERSGLLPRLVRFSCLGQRCGIPEPAQCVSRCAFYAEPRVFDCLGIVVLQVERAGERRCKVTRLRNGVKSQRTLHQSDGSFEFARPAHDSRCGAEQFGVGGGRRDNRLHLRDGSAVLADQREAIGVGRARTWVRGRERHGLSGDIEQLLSGDEPLVSGGPSLNESLIDDVVERILASRESGVDGDGALKRATHLDGFSEVGRRSA